MKRSTIVKRIHANSQKIKALRQANIELNRQHLLLSDKNQWYIEAEETHGRGKNKETALIGRVYWKEGFKDEDTGQVVYIERSCAVRKNNDWIEGY